MSVRGMGPVRAPGVLSLDDVAWVTCTCREPAGGPYPTEAEGRLLAGLHDQLHHASRSTAVVVRGPGCESCRHAPATRSWSRPGAGAPFRLCARCAPDDAAPLPTGGAG